MRKIIFSITTIVMLSSTCLFAQDAQKTGNDLGTPEPVEVTRRLGFSILADSGYVTSIDKYPLFYGNDINFGASYSQNFSTAPWITLSLGAAWFLYQYHSYDSDGNYGGHGAGTLGSLASYIGNVVAGIGANFNLSHFGMNGFSALVYMDTRLRGTLRFAYAKRFGEANKHLFAAAFAAEIYVLPLVSSDTIATIWNEENEELELTYESIFSDEGDYIQKYINVMWIQAAYGYTINKTWSTDAIVYFRTGGHPTAHYDSDNENRMYWATETNGITETHYGITFAECYAWNISLRLGWNIRATFDRLAFWAGIRCTMYHLFTPEDAIFQTVLRGGMSYAFDISKL